MEGVVQGRTGDWGEVVTRYPYENVGMDHLLSKEKVSDRRPRVCELVGRMRVHGEILFNFEGLKKDTNMGV